MNCVKESSAFRKVPGEEEQGIEGRHGLKYLRKGPPFPEQEPLKPYPKNNNS